MCVTCWPTVLRIWCAFPYTPQTPPPPVPYMPGGWCWSGLGWCGHNVEAVLGTPLEKNIGKSVWAEQNRNTDCVKTLTFRGCLSYQLVINVLINALQLNLSPSSPSQFPPCNEWHKPEPWVPSSVLHSYLLDTSRQQPSPVHSALSISVESVLIYWVISHWHFLVQDAILLFLDYFYFPLTHVCVAPAPKHTLKHLSLIVKVVTGDCRELLVWYIPHPAISITYIYWVSAMGSGY